MKKLSSLKKDKDLSLEYIDKIAQINCFYEDKVERNDFFKILYILVPEKTDNDKIKSLKRKAYSSLKSVFKIKPIYLDDWIIENNKYIKKISNKFQKEIFEEYEESSKKLDIEEYDTFIFDADFTLWTGALAKDMISPFSKLNESTISDCEGKIIKLKDGVKETLIKLRSLGKNIGIISHSENIQKKVEEQPLLEILKALKIYDLINDKIVIFSDFPKSMFIPENKRVIFIDDDIKNLKDVDTFTNAKTLDSENVEFEKIASKYEKNIEDFLEEVYSKGYSNPFNGREIVIGNVRLEFGISTGRKQKHCINIKTIISMNRKNGEASTVLDFITSLADKYGIELFLFAVPLNIDKKNGLNKNQLKKWYSSRGFEAEEESDGMVRNPKDIVVKDENVEGNNAEEKQSFNFSWYKISKRDYIPKSEIPKKPEDGNEYHLDHKIPRYKGGKDSKDNLQWIRKDKHIKKTKDEGSYEFGGQDRRDKLKSKGKKYYKKYQSDAAKTKIKKERENLGEKEFSKLQSERAKRRWNKKD